MKLLLVISSADQSSTSISAALLTTTSARYLGTYCIATMVQPIGSRIEVDPSQLLQYLPIELAHLTMRLDGGALDDSLNCNAAQLLMSVALSPLRPLA